MAGELRDVTTKLWAEGPQICNLDPELMPHFNFLAVCNHEDCEETIPFAVGMGREMRKHFNEKHRLHCKACKKGDFNSKEEMEIHLFAVHKDGVCFKCHASFNLASALAMHIEGPKNTCSVPQSALVSALRYFQKKHNGVTDPNAVYSPISCCPGGEQTIQKLKEYRKTLLLAHKKAFSDMQEIELPPSPASGTIYLHNIGYTSPVYSYANSPESSTKSPKIVGGSAASEHGGYESPLVKRMSQELAIKAEQENLDSFAPKEWTCSTCVDAKFTSLSKLMQHVEAKVRNNWWKSLNN